MKARIKGTNEIVMILESRSDIVLVKDWLGIRRFVTPDSLEAIKVHPTFSVDDATNDIDWEQRRFELVKAVLQGMCANNDIILANLANSFETGKMCIGIADAVIAEYRKGDKQ